MKKSFSVARILSENKENILKIWEERTRKALPAAIKETRSALRNSIPEFLDDLILAFKTDIQEVRPDLIRFAHYHGSERAHLSQYTLEDALSEYNILRKVIFEILEGKITLSNKERDLIYEAIHIGLAKAGAEYTKLQNELREQSFRNAEIERKKLRVIIDQLPAAVWIAEAPSGEIVLSNQLSRTIMQQPKDPANQLIQYGDYIGFFPDGKKYQSTDWPLARSILKGEVIKDEIVKVQKSDGSVGYVRLDSAPIRNDAGKIVSAVAIGTDITDYKEAEEKLRLTQERFNAATSFTGIGVWDLDLKTNTAWRNETHDFSFGYKKPLDHWSFEKAEEHVHPDDREFFRNSMTQAVQQKGNWKVEFRVIWPDKSIHWMSASGKVLTDEKGEPCKVVGTNFDITNSKLALEALNEEKILREKFVSTLSHDLRTPLTAAKMSAELIKRKVDQDPAPSLALRIVDNLNRANKMIEDLLDASKIRAGQGVLAEIQHIDLVDVTQQALDNLATIYGDRFKLSAPDKVEAHLCPYGMRRIVENLCSNAIKYGSPHDPVSISIELRNHKVVLCVRNHGHPVNNIDKDKLFEPFKRGTAAEVSRKKGWGIGLTIVKGIAEAHHGEVSVDTSQEGTTFKVLLPLDARVDYFLG